MLIERLVRELDDLGATVRLESAVSSVDRAPDDFLRIDLDGATALFAVEVKSRSPYPSEVAGLDRLREQLSVLGQPLLFAPYISAGQGAALTSHGWSWADDQGNFDLRSGPLRLRQRVARTASRKPRVRIPRGGGGLAVVRLLIRRPPDLGTDRLRQTRLAKAAGVSQARVAQVIGQLREAELVTSRDGSSDEDRARLLDAFLAAYPGPGGTERYFYTLDPLRAVAKRLATRHPRWTAVASADVGPDLVAPFRAPTILVVYARGPVDLDLSGLVAAGGRGDSNVVVRSPSDSSVFGSDDLTTIRLIDETPVRLADPTQMIWDLGQLGGEDRMEVAEVLRKWLLTPR